MTLRAKFLLLVGMLALAVAGSIGAARWSFLMLRDQLATPLASSSMTLDALSHIKRGTGIQALVLRGAPTGDLDIDAATQHHAGDGAQAAGRSGAPPAPTPEQRRAYHKAASDVERRLASLEEEEKYRTLVGSATWRGLKDHLGKSDALAKRWLEQRTSAAPDAPAADDPADAARLASLDELLQIQELIEKTERRIHKETRIAVSTGGVIEAKLGWWLGSVFLVVALSSVLAVVLLERWVHRPVSLLREAAARIAAGDFSHRVPVAGVDELGLLTAEVNHMAGMVNKLQEERIERERLAAIGGVMRRLVHSLRNPLSGIRGLAEVTRMRMASGSEGRENLDHIVSTVETFERWLNELLDSTSPANLALVDADVRPWLDAVLDAHRPMAQTRDVRLALDADAAPRVARFDPVHLQHALAALVSNAIEASPAGGEVRVVASRSQDEKTWDVHVRDQGPGVPENLRSRIFEPNFTTKPHGNGIGLASAAQIALAHGGRLSLEITEADAAGRIGASFLLRIPLSGGSGEPLGVADESQLSV